MTATAPTTGVPARLVGAAVWVSAARCVVAYVALPLVAPAAGAARIAAPVLLGLHALGITMTARVSLRCPSSGRWGLGLLSATLLSLNLLSVGRYLGV